MPDVEDQVNPYGQLINQQPIYDLLLNLDVQMEADNRGKVIKQVTAPDGSQLGSYDKNPALNTIMYEVEFDDGMVQEYVATTIAENILDKVDSDGFLSPILKAIVDWKKGPDVAVPKLKRICPVGLRAETSENYQLVWNMPSNLMRKMGIICG